MRHLNGKKDRALCGAKDGERTGAALESDCNDCRAKVFVGPMDQKGCSLRVRPMWEAQPLTGEDWVAELQRKRDGF